MARLQGFVGPSEAFERTLEKGVFFGMVASIPMGLFAMAASASYQGRGFYTPAYHVAFTIDPNTLGLSLERAGAGERFFFSHEAFMFGLAFHVIVAGVFGALFALVGTRLRVAGTQPLVAGLVYGLAVMVLMSALVLPIVGAASGAGDPISRMGGEVGWPTFAVLHAIFGLALGTWLHVRPQDFEE